MTAPEQPTINPNSPVWQLRTLIPDVEKLRVPGTLNEYSYIFPDEMLETYLQINNGNLRLALSDAYYALGSSEAMISRVIKTEDLQTDGAKVMQQFRMQADQIRRQAKSEDVAIGGTVFIDGETLGGCGRPELGPPPTYLYSDMGVCPEWH